MPKPPGMESALAGRSEPHSSLSVARAPHQPSPLAMLSPVQKEPVRVCWQKQARVLHAHVAEAKSPVEAKGRLVLRHHPNRDATEPLLPGKPHECCHQLPTDASAAPIQLDIKVM